jgi:hypothetical protein
MIRIRPTETRFVDIRHEDWGLDWSIQFPEAIVSAEGSAMSWEPFHEVRSEGGCFQARSDGAATVE